MWICLYSIQTWLPQMIHADIPLSMDNSTLDMWFTSKISQKSSQLNATAFLNKLKNKNAPLMLFSEAHYLIISWNCWQQLVYLHHLLTLLCGQCINGVHECLWQLIFTSGCKSLFIKYGGMCGISPSLLLIPPPPCGTSQHSCAISTVCYITMRSVKHYCFVSSMTETICMDELHSLILMGEISAS